MTNPPENTPQQQDPASTGSGHPRGAKIRGGLTKARNWFLRMVFFVLLALVAGFTLWTWAALSFSYSHGEKAGYLQMFTQRGWVFKTWEGELALVNLPGAMPEVFKFSAKDDAAVRKLQENLGKRVKLIYDEHPLVPFRWWGETSFFVVDVVPIAE